MKLKLILFGMAIGLASCKNYKTEMEQANHERDSLYEAISMRDSSINDFLESYNEIQVNLDSIANKGETISSNMNSESQVKSSREKINEDIASINAMVKENRQKITELNRKLKNSGNKNAKLEKMIEALNSRIADKDKELADLNDRLTAMNANITQLQTSVDTLTATTAKQAQTISDQTTVIHTAYYKVGKSRQLQDMKIINKQGGLLGIGKSSKLNENIDNSKFTKIDYTQVTTIPVNGDNAKIITAHPASSYAMDKEGKNKVTNIRITNPELFWSASKYLVVMIN
jgi:predicted  nucleic acid-binding Zn-ribbon protein